MAIFISQIIILILGVTIIVLAGWGFFAPEKLMTLVTSTMDRQWGIYIAVVVRLVLGAALIVVASASLFPMTFQALGSIAIVAAAALAVAGRERIRNLIVWFFERFSVQILRLWLLLGAAFGAFLIYGVL